MVTFVFFHGGLFELKQLGASLPMSVLQPRVVHAKVLVILLQYPDGRALYTDLSDRVF